MIFTAKVSWIKHFENSMKIKFSFELDCYRRKQRGDCDSFEFHRAATERAQYVHNRHHPDQQTMSRHPRSSSLRDTSRRPSLTLRQLERQFLSHQPSIDSCHDEVC